MTKLMQWIAGLVLFLAIYIPVLTKMIVVPALEPYEREIKLLPFILVAFFGIHSLNVVLFRAATIRDCPEAEQELQKDIQDARADLLKKGFKFASAAE